MVFSRLLGPYPSPRCGTAREPGPLNCGNILRESFPEPGPDPRNLKKEPGPRAPPRCFFCSGHLPGVLCFCRTPPRCPFLVGHLPGVSFFVFGHPPGVLCLCRAPSRCPFLFRAPSRCPVVCFRATSRCPFSFGHLPGAQEKVPQICKCLTLLISATSFTVRVPTFQGQLWNTTRPFWYGTGRIHKAVARTQTRSAQAMTLDFCNKFQTHLDAIRPKISGPVFQRFSAEPDPGDPLRSPGSAPHIKMCEKSAPQTHSKTISRHPKSTARLPSGTQVTFPEETAL